MQSSTTLALLTEQAVFEFKHRFGRPPRWLVAAPGRVNLIGEHTDYNDGFVFPMAIDRHVVIAADAAAPHHKRSRCYSTASDAPADVPVDGADLPGMPTWARYVQGVFAGFRHRGYSFGPFDAVIHADVPLGGGLSSSAALEVAVATLLESMTGVTLSPMDKALLCQQAEHNYAGVPCGIMDQCACIMSKAGHALLLDCRSCESRLIPWTDPNVVSLIINSNVKHALTDGGYAARRQQCTEAARLMGVASLRDADMTLLGQHRERLGDLLFRRARHVVQENERVLHAEQAIRNSDWETMGRLMLESHVSLRDDYQVSCMELDALVDAATEAGTPGGVIGSRMTGGGFGGCTVTLVRRETADKAVQRLCDSYQTRTGKVATAFVTRPMDGARILTAPSTA